MTTWATVHGPRTFLLFLLWYTRRYMVHRAVAPYSSGKYMVVTVHRDGDDHLLCTDLVVLPGMLGIPAGRQVMCDVRGSVEMMVMVSVDDVAVDPFWKLLNRVAGIYGGSEWGKLLFYSSGCSPVVHINICCCCTPVIYKCRYFYRDINVISWYGK